MCYGCRITCDDCKPKFVFCSKCGWRNLLIMDECVRCERPITEAEKEQARSEWLHQKNKN